MNMYHASAIDLAVLLMARSRLFTLEDRNYSPASLGWHSHVS